MTRRELLLAASAGASSFLSEEPVRVPLQPIWDRRARCARQPLRSFLSCVWPETIRDFARCGIVFQGSLQRGEIRRSPGGRPIFMGLERSAINLVLTDHIPMYWDHGRALAGVSTRHEGHDLCVIALNHAHCHEIPFLSVNTCIHELLHVLLRDILDSQPNPWKSGLQEFRIDVYATRLWLFHDGAAIRTAAEAYVDRLRSR